MLLVQSFWTSRRQFLVMIIVCYVTVQYLVLYNNARSASSKSKSASLIPLPETVLSADQPLVHPKTVKVHQPDGPSYHQQQPISKLILLWNNFFDVGHFYTSKLSRDLLIRANCPVTNCEFIDDLEQFNQSDVVIFFAQYLYEVPSYRFPHQNFIFFQMESPANTKSKTLVANKTRFDFFNRTMTYRLDSDIVDVELHGKIIKKRPTAESNYDTSSRLRKPSSKTKLVAWFTTNCETKIQREEYVRQLSQHIQVDIYGHCGDLPEKCGGWNRHHCDEMLRKDYKFYLALENSWCPDYVTEKFFRTLHYDTIPIVMGGANYSRFAPPNSYIDVADFASPLQLAEYLLLLDRDDELYDRYFDWKKYYEVELNPMDGWCDLCQMAHDKSLKPKVYHDISQWWTGDGSCERSFFSIMSMTS